MLDFVNRFRYNMSSSLRAQNLIEEVTDSATYPSKATVPVAMDAAEGKQSSGRSDRWFLHALVDGGYRCSHIESAIPVQPRLRFLDDRHAGICPYHCHDRLAPRRLNHDVPGDGIFPSEWLRAPTNLLLAVFYSRLVLYGISAERLCTQPMVQRDGEALWYP